MRANRWTWQFMHVQIIQGSKMQKKIQEWQRLGATKAEIRELGLAESKDAIPMPRRIQLGGGIFVAPLMVQAAIDALNQHLDYASPTRDPATWAKVQSLPADPNHSDVGLGLMKYFHLAHQPGSEGDTYWKHVKGIIEVYRKIHAGLTCPYEIVLEDMGRHVAGRVTNYGAFPKPVSPIREVFGFTDEYGHEDWTKNTGEMGRIKLGIHYILNPIFKKYDYARTIVHEASHKFARTKDILYKASSFAKDPEGAAEQERFKGAAKLAQTEISIPGRAKPLKPITGFDKQGGGILPIPDIRYLENADSYAWMARRCWKRARQGIDSPKAAASSAH